MAVTQITTVDRTNQDIGSKFHTGLSWGMTQHFSHKIVTRDFICTYTLYNGSVYSYYLYV